MTLYMHFYSKDSLEENTTKLNEELATQAQTIAATVCGNHHWDFGLGAVVEYHRNLERHRWLEGLQESIDKAIADGAGETEAREHELVAFIDNLKRAATNIPTRGYDFPHGIAEHVKFEVAVELYGKFTEDIVLGISQQRLLNVDHELERKARVQRALDKLDEQVKRGHKTRGNDKVTWQRVLKVVKPVLAEDKLVTGVEGRWESTYNRVRIHGNGVKAGSVTIFTHWSGDYPEGTDDYHERQRYDFQQGIAALEPVVEALDEYGYAYKTNFDLLTREGAYVGWSDMPVITVTGFKFSDDEVKAERDRIESLDDQALRLAYLY
jgi:hypothetical protein